MQPTTRHIAVNGLRHYVREQGEGPLVLLLHGFPECSHAWRHQLDALAAAGFHAVAPDLRGFAQSDAPEDPGAYTVLHLVGDMVGLVHALGERTACIVGHDWGGPIAWAAALVRPDMFRAVASLSSPYRPRPPQPPLQMLVEAGHREHYYFYFRSEAAVREFEQDVETTLRKLLGGRMRRNPLNIPEGGAFLDAFDPSEQLPPWLGADDFAILVGEYQRSGFRAPLYLYHNVDRNWELLAAWSGVKIEQPALFIAGKRDPVIASGLTPLAIEQMGSVVVNLRTLWLEDVGHWTQQEAPEEVSRALVEFLREAAPPAALHVR